MQYRTLCVTFQPHYRKDNVAHLVMTAITKHAIRNCGGLPENSDPIVSTAVTSISIARNIVSALL